MLLLSLLHVLAAFRADFIQRESLHRRPLAEASSVAEFVFDVPPPDSGDTLLEATGTAKPMTSPSSSTLISVDDL